ncbi:ferredoxin [Nocardia sp. NPDC050175]|uniref:ferredoxin n=1 Tax=Nocardia sp. NPDC050175 TaxID=3364317 RepID=UPI00378CB047
MGSTVEVDQELCLGSGYCVHAAPEVFGLPDDVVELRTGTGGSGPVEVPGELVEAVHSAELACPAAAITLRNRAG